MPLLVVYIWIILSKNLISFFLFLFSNRIWLVIKEATLPRFTWIWISLIGFILLLIQYVIVWTVPSNVTAFERACIHPNDRFVRFTKNAWFYLVILNVIYQAVAVIVCLRIYLWLRAEDKDSTLRDKYSATVREPVGTIFPHLS